MQRKPFDLQAALEGKPVVTSSGRKITEIHHLKTAHKNMECIVAVTEDGYVKLSYIDGKYDCSNDSIPGNLFMAEEEKEMCFYCDEFEIRGKGSASCEICDKQSSDFRSYKLAKRIKALEEKLKC